MTLNDAYIYLGEQQVKLYHTNPGVYMDAFCSGSGIREIMCNYYRILTKRGKLLYLEVVDKEMKQYLKETALEISNGRLDVDECMSLCKCLYILSNEKV